MWLQDKSSKIGLTRKFGKNWIGPFVVTEKLNAVNYRIKHLMTKRSKLVHVKLLKSCTYNGEVTENRNNYQSTNLNLSEDEVSISNDRETTLLNEELQHQIENIFIPIQTDCVSSDVVNLPVVVDQDSFLPSANIQAKTQNDNMNRSLEWDNSSFGLIKEVTPLLDNTYEEIFGQDATVVDENSIYEPNYYYNKIINTNLLDDRTNISPRPMRARKKPDRYGYD